MGYGLGLQLCPQAARDCPPSRMCTADLHPGLPIIELRESTDNRIKGFFTKLFMNGFAHCPPVCKLSRQAKTLGRDTCIAAPSPAKQTLGVLAPLRGRWRPGGAPGSTDTTSTRMKIAAPPKPRNRTPCSGPRRAWVLDLTAADSQVQQSPGCRVAYVSPME